VVVQRNKKVQFEEKISIVVDEIQSHRLKPEVENKATNWLLYKE